MAAFLARSAALALALTATDAQDEDNFQLTIGESSDWPVRPHYSYTLARAVARG